MKVGMTLLVLVAFVYLALAKGEASSMQTLVFSVSTNSTPSNAEIIDCVQHFLTKMSEGKLKSELPNLGSSADDSMTELHQLVVRTGAGSTGCSLIWTAAGAKENSVAVPNPKEYNTVQSHEQEERMKRSPLGGLLSSLLGGGRKRRSPLLGLGSRHTGGEHDVERREVEEERKKRSPLLGLGSRHHTGGEHDVERREVEEEERKKRSPLLGDLLGGGRKKRSPLGGLLGGLLGGGEGGEEERRKRSPLLGTLLGG